MADGRRWLWGVQVFGALLLVWLALDGLENLAVGVLAAAIAAAVGAVLAPVAPGGWQPWRLVSFAGFFVVESVRGAVDVAWRALHPALPIAPAVVHHRIGLPAGKPRTLLVSVVSLLPGTLSADLLAGENTLVVHAITPDPLAGVQALERRIARLFGLTLEVRP